MIVCDLCNQQKECSKRQIEGKEYDICSGCWEPIVEKLKGKGRVTKERDRVLLPPSIPQPSIPQPEPSEPKQPPPERPPKIWARDD